MNWYVKQLYVESARKLPNISYRDLAKFMKLLGYEQIPGKGKGDHGKWKQQQTGQMVTILDPSGWKGNSKNVIEYILKNMGVSPKDFAKLWNDKKFRKNPSSHIDVGQYQPGGGSQNLMRSQPEQQDPNDQSNPNHQINQ